MSRRSKEKKARKNRPKPKPPSERTDLHKAAAAGKLEDMLQLLKDGADRDKQDKYGQTPLMLAIHCGQRQAAGALLRAGARTDICDSDGRDMVMNAARQPDVKLLEQLLAHGADASRISPHGETALGFVLPLLRAEHAELLRQAGAPEPPGVGAFEPVAQQECQALQADLGEGGVHMARLTERAADIPAGAPLLSAFLFNRGFRPIANRWRVSNRAGLEYMLALDLIHVGPLRTDEQAAALAGRFLELLGDGETKPELYTTLHGMGDGFHSYTPVTWATFNVVTIGVTPDRIGIIWVDQED